MSMTSTESQTKAVTVKFEKYFVAGVLEGITYSGDLTFADWSSASRWIAGVQGKTISQGTSVYRYVKCWIA